MWDSLFDSRIEGRKTILFALQFVNIEWQLLHEASSLSKISAARWITSSSKFGQKLKGIFKPIRKEKVFK